MKSSRFNKYVIDEKGNQKRNGMWIENSSSNNGELQEKGKYRNGEKVGLWKTSFEGKIYQKERFLKDYSYHNLIAERNCSLVCLIIVSTSSNDLILPFFFDKERSTIDL